MPAPLLLHVFYSFETGGAQVRTVTLMNSLGGRFRHAIAAINGDMSCATRIAPHVDWRAVTPRGFRALIRDVEPALLITYNWGAIDAQFALLPGRPCPALHVEDGFGPDEALRLKARRVWARRLVLPLTARALAVPSQTLRRIALDRYRLPAKMVRYIPNGVDTERFAPRRDPELRRSLGIPAEAVVFGSAGRFRAEKDLVWMVRRFAESALPEARLLLVGAGPAEPEIRAAVRACGIEKTVIFSGETADSAPFFAVFDAFLMSSGTEQMPMGLLEAMSSGLPALCTNVGDCRAVLPPAHAPLAVDRNQPASYVNYLRRLAANAEWRAALGRGNRQRAVAEFSLSTMVDRWERLYLEALGMTPPPQQQDEHIP